MTGPPLRAQRVPVHHLESALFWRSLMACAGETMRRFELSDGKSNKFWQASTAGSSMTVTFGKIGTNGQSQTKDFASATAATAEMEKLIREKTKKGYTEA